MPDYMEFPDFNVSTPEGKQMQEYLIKFQEKFNHLAQIVSEEIQKKEGE